MFVCDINESALKELEQNVSGVITKVCDVSRRVVKIEGDLLHLSTASPIFSGGKTVNSFLTWKRA